MLTRPRIALIAICAIAAIAAGILVVRSLTGLPRPGSEKYEQVTRAFYRGLAALEVGLVDDAKREFTAVTTQVPEEPAAWANLGLAHLRLGELDEAATPIEQALMLAPDNADLALLAGRMEISRGRLDDGIAHLRRAVELEPGALQSRFALFEEVERAGSADADTQALAQIDELAKLAPQNIAVIVERARIAAKTQDRQRLTESIERLKPIAEGWPPAAVEQYQALQAALAANDFPVAQQSTAFLRNVLARVPAFSEDLSAIRTPTELISEPIDRFIVLPPPASMPAAPDLSLTFAEEAIAQSLKQPVGVVVAVPTGDGPQELFAGDSVFALQSLMRAGARIPFPRPDDSDTVPTSTSVAVADWNGDFRNDIVVSGESGVRLFLQQTNGDFADQTPTDAKSGNCVCHGVWAADVEMDGDIDVVAADENAPFVLRNNADGSWTRLAMFGGMRTAVDFAWGDLDHDGDPDAVFLADGGDGVPRLHAFANRQAGDFAVLPSVPATAPLTLTIGDLNADGAFEVVAFEASGAIRALTYSNGQWTSRDIATWPAFDPDEVTERLFIADFDNNGAMDLVATSARESRIWLGNESRELQLVEALPRMSHVFPAGDLNGDGRLDLAGIMAGAKVVRLLNKGRTSYHWKQIRLRAQETAGDQRVNSFGVGGYLEARAGLLFQKHLVTGGPVHIGLGTQSSIDVARIVWPNGIAQAEFGLDVDDVIEVEQRLKGSCPWVFTWDGTRMVFVTDFLWRSPLGLRINAQDTAGITQTEDWVRLRGDQLVARNGLYDVRITAELWETHFFDHVSLMAVDHPADTEVFVDERFSPTSPPALKVHAVRNLRPVARAVDHRGTDVTGTIIRRDGEYLSTFSRGRYQGIAEDHFVEVELDGSSADALIATGWIYPTDSSINVAIAQAGITPRGLSLEALNANGSWRVVNGDLGFPAGKDKTLVIDLSGVSGARKVRLRTNLEIYWDSLQLGARSTSPIRTTRIAASGAELRYRGFSNTVSPRGNAPERAEYDRVVSTSPRWRDLTGYHTRFGDVRELIEQVDDRYVIMNAGDELRLQFPESPAAGTGWRRDFVLIGDGWEKDGDYNTGFSQTVLPLPSHDNPAYGAGSTSLELEDDPVYQRHREDWQRFHTRYVTPRRFLDALQPARRN